MPIQTDEEVQQGLPWWTPNLPNELEPDPLILSEPTWDTHQKAEKARCKVKHLKVVSAQGQAHEKGSSTECCVSRHSLRSEPAGWAPDGRGRRQLAMS